MQDLNREAFGGASVCVRVGGEAEGAGAVGGSGSKEGENEFEGIDRLSAGRCHCEKGEWSDGMAGRESELKEREEPAQCERQQADNLGATTGNSTEEDPSLGEEDRELTHWTGKAAEFKRWG